MRQYYNIKKKMLINLSQDVSTFEAWIKDNSIEYSCCQHPNGFYIFLEPIEIQKYDEYKNDNPYTLSDIDFHKRRLNCTIELIKRLETQQNIKLLDLGCGQGHFTNEFKKRFPKFDVFGLDYSISAIDYANSNFKEIDFVVANAYYPPYPDEYFDIIVCNNIWEHVPDPLVLLNAISRVLKPNGLLIISTPSRYRLINILRILLGKNVVFMSGLHVTEYTVGQIIEQLKYGGYKIDRIYSPRIKEGGLIFWIIKFIFSILLKAIKSHHVLEATVFYSARKLVKKEKDI